jgi:hypothetical protein
MKLFDKLGLRLLFLLFIFAVTTLMTLVMEVIVGDWDAAKGTAIWIFLALPLAAVLRGIIRRHGDRAIRISRRRGD